MKWHERAWVSNAPRPPEQRDERIISHPVALPGDSDPPIAQQPVLNLSADVQIDDLDDHC